MHILTIIWQDSAQRLHISAQRIIISSLPIAMHMEQQDMHISAHIAHILLHMDEPRIIMPMVIWHMAAQSWSMHIISGVMPSILLQHIIISMHIDMHMPQSSIHRHIESMFIFIMSIGLPLSFRWIWLLNQPAYAGKIIIQQEQPDSNREKRDIFLKLKSVLSTATQRTEKNIMSEPSKQSFSTRAIHTGEPIERASGAVEPSISLSTNFSADPDRIGFSAESLGDDSPYFYARWATPTVRALEEKLASLEGGEDALCFASGMAAISALLLGTLHAGDHLLLSDVCYAGLAELAHNTLPTYGIHVTTVDCSDLDAVRNALRTTTKLVWVETPANPILRLADIATIAGIAHEAGARLVVDSTMATPIATRPLELGADYVVHSLTKYLNGHGDALGGAIIGNRLSLVSLRQSALIHLGGTLSPFNAWLIRRGLHTLELRMQRHADSAMHIAEWLEQRSGITRVLYPGLASHPQHALARKQMKNFSGMLTFQTKEDVSNVARQLYRKLKVFTYAVSLGKQRSLIWHIPTREILDN